MHQPAFNTIDSPRVSVVTPFFNSEKYLDEAIRSVLWQTYDNWELLLVDDGSTDGSTAIARRYAERYPERIIYLCHVGSRNLGKSISRNLGIQKATGKYLAFLDADDVFLPEKLARQVALLESHPDLAMVYGPTRYWHSWSEPTGKRGRDYQGKLGVRPNTVFGPPTLLTLFLDNPGMVPSICGLLLRRSVVMETGGFEERIHNLYEDQVLLAKICLSGKVLVDGGCWDLYRQHSESSSFAAIHSGQYHPFLPHPARQAFLEWLGQYLQARGSMTDPALRKAFEKAWWPYRHPRLAKAIFGLRYRLRQLTNRFWGPIRTLVSRRDLEDLTSLHARLRTGGFPES
ncbi:glycosyltransferase family 2 protein [Methylocaldum sp.]|uniref:glycosyltransferase family 2 protein n=1 Tax=Methylocaldum sp. TaxID=1969727 RepID=UPI002D4FC532|nr:glycosyltransferase family 2 protein [Methylocaldum sp.]HYE35252.1 glycosyltransferase family 2 protein [Methylocaldum sp.]